MRPERAQAQLAVACVDAAAGHFGVLGHDGVVHLHDRRAVGGQAAASMLICTARSVAPSICTWPTPRADSIDALHVAVGEEIQLAGFARAGDGQRHDRRGVEVLLLHDRRIDVRRQAVEDAGDGVAHVLRRPR